MDLTRVKEAILRDLDHVLQQSFHQRLGEVINDLRVHDYNLSPNPSPDEVFTLVRRTHLLCYTSVPAVVELRESIERLYDGTFGACHRCGKPIDAATLETFPESRFCRSCSQHTPPNTIRGNHQIS
jgi:hypothetical protein